MNNMVIWLLDQLHSTSIRARRSKSSLLWSRVLGCSTQAVQIDDPIEFVRFDFSGGFGLFLPQISFAYSEIFGLAFRVFFVAEVERTLSNQSATSGMTLGVSKKKQWLLKKSKSAASQE